ncbi:AbrB/MazE/SpoVT family DNA-binding domain-containing protein [Paenibacillus lautus]|uniref:AbrB/MazE/SpoVT family DNA-binding domain-containing protein n=1 Tax=Paenibacillus lautus TaxID=1401 RepID=UPI002DB6C34F|nr:AbrB/MazE/SpoVT family DNA-binding domain-containing protein [Paenibacillus lautus]MEC0259333.1 AbrB/MazE/SpoVT family DNA-binding domain-containing protein [Paenibacillus lautus]
MQKKKYIRSIDEIGRIVLPKHLRKELHLGEKQMLEVYNDGERIIIEKYDNLEPCLVTGKSTKYNHTFTFGDETVTLSPEGLEKMIEELSEYKKSLT